MKVRGISINGKVHTYTDLGAIVLSAQYNNPEPKRLFDDIPAMNGKLDYSNYYGGMVFYDNRDVTFQFFVCGKPADVTVIVDRFNFWHGQQIEIVDDKYPEHRLRGWASVAVELASKFGNYAYITLTLDAEPFREKLRPTEIYLPTLSGMTTVQTYTLAPAQLILKVNSLEGTPEKKAVEVYMDGSTIFQAVENVGTTEITNFLLTPGRQQLRVSASMWSESLGSWVPSTDVTADVEIRYREAKF